MIRVTHINEVRVIREPLSLFSICYNPKERDPGQEKSYEYCRNQIDDARNKEYIDEKQHDWFVYKLTKIREEYIFFKRLLERLEPELP